MTDRANVAAETRDALQKVEEHADPEWKQGAYAAIIRTALVMPEFISDDVWTVGGLTGTREDRALGPEFLRAKRAGIAVKTDRVRPSIRSHLSGKPVWRSLIYGSPPDSYYRLLGRRGSSSELISPISASSATDGAAAAPAEESVDKEMTLW